MVDLLKKIKKKISEASRAVTDEFYVGQDKKARVRFLIDLEDGLEVTWHDKFEDGVNTPCFSHFGLSCPYCDISGKDKPRTRQFFAWTIFNYETDKKQIFRYPANSFSPIPSLVAMYEAYGTLCDRDFVITRTGTGFEINYQVVPMDKSNFKGDKKPFTKIEIFKKWAKMYDILEESKKQKKTKEEKVEVEKVKTEEVAEEVTKEAEDDLEYQGMKFDE